MRAAGSRMTVILWAAGLAFLAQVAASPTPCHAQTTVFIVRHAEKAKLPANDPKLTEAGHARAKTLAQMLRSVTLTAALASEFERTLQTVQPAASEQNIEVTRYRAGSTADLAKRILTKHQGGTLLVAGHSNTVPMLLAGLGVDTAKIPEIGHDDYDDLFLVFIGKAGDVTLQQLRYGAPTGADTPRRATSDAAAQPTGE